MNSALWISRHFQTKSRARTRIRICKPFKEPRSRYPASGSVRQPYLTYRPGRLHRLAESSPWNRFLGSLNVWNYGLCDLNTARATTILHVHLKHQLLLKGELEGWIQLRVVACTAIFSLPPLTLHLPAHSKPNQMWRHSTLVGTSRFKRKRENSIHEC